MSHRTHRLWRERSGGARRRLTETPHVAKCLVVHLVRLAPGRLAPSIHGDILLFCGAETAERIVLVAGGKAAQATSPALGLRGERSVESKEAGHL